MPDCPVQMERNVPFTDAVCVLHFTASAQANLALAEAQLSRFDGRCHHNPSLRSAKCWIRPSVSVVTQLITQAWDYINVAHVFVCFSAPLTGANAAGARVQLAFSFLVGVIQRAKFIWILRKRHKSSSTMTAAENVCYTLINVTSDSEPPSEVSLKTDLGMFYCPSPCLSSCGSLTPGRLLEPQS